MGRNPCQCWCCTKLSASLLEDSNLTLRYHIHMRYVMPFPPLLPPGTTSCQRTSCSSLMVILTPHMMPLSTLAATVMAASVALNCRCVFTLPNNYQEPVLNSRRSVLIYRVPQLSCLADKHCHAGQHY